MARRVSRIFVVLFYALGLLVLFGCTATHHQTLTSLNSSESTYSVKSKSNVKTTSKVKMQKSINDKLEALSAVSYDGDKFTASVISHGCTSSTDFNVEYEIANGRCNVSIIRSKPDLCRRAPLLANLTIDWPRPDDCTDLELFIVNPVLVTSDTGRIIKRAK